MATTSVPDGLSIGLASAEGVAPSEPDSVVENHDGVSEESGENDDKPPTKKIKHVDLPKTAASDYSTKSRCSDFRNNKNQRKKNNGISRHLGGKSQKNSKFDHNVHREAMRNPIENAQEIRHHVAPAKPRIPTKSRLKQSLNKSNI